MKKYEKFLLNFQRIQKKNEQLKLSYSEIAARSDVSLNTVKAILAGSGGSTNTINRVERALEQEEIRRRAMLAAGSTSEALPDNFADQLELGHKLAETLKDITTRMLRSAPVSASVGDLERLELVKRQIRAAISDLKLLTDNP